MGLRKINQSRTAFIISNWMNQIANIQCIIEKSREFRKHIYFCFIDYDKAFDCVDHNKQWKILKEMAIPVYLTCLVWNLYTGQKATVRTGHVTSNFFKNGKDYVKDVYCHPAYLTYMHSTSCKMVQWMKHKLKSRLPGKISITSHMQTTPPLWQKQKGTKEPLDENERREWKRISSTSKQKWIEI